MAPIREPLKPVPFGADNAQLVSAPTARPLDMSLTDLALRGDRATPPHQFRLTSPQAANAEPKRSKPTSSAASKSRKVARRNPEYLLHQHKKDKAFVRKPATTEDHITRATRLIEAERMAAEVDEALRSVKDGFAAEMDRCMKRKRDSARKNEALMEAMHNFSEFVMLNDRWIEDNEKRTVDDEQLTKAYREKKIKLITEQEQAMQKRCKLRKQWQARQEYKKFVEEALSMISGYNDMEHFVGDTEQQIAIVACADQTVSNLESLKREAQTFRDRLQKATEERRKDLHARREELELAQASLKENLAKVRTELENANAEFRSDVEEYMETVSKVDEMYNMSCDLMKTETHHHARDHHAKLKLIEQCLNDAHIVRTAVDFVYRNVPWQSLESYPREKLDEITGLVGSGYFQHVTYKQKVHPVPFVPPEKPVITVTKAKEREESLH